MPDNGNPRRDAGEPAPPPDPEKLRRRARDLASDTRRTFAERVNEAGGRGLDALGDRADRAGEYFDRRRAEGRSRLGERLHHAGDYLHDADLRELLGDADRAIAAHPYRAMAVALAAGYLLGRLLGR
jgi:ElaB/YqjD/DUF883 family membrane-anchored ribosome-binding protein